MNRPTDLVLLILGALILLLAAVKLRCRQKLKDIDGVVGVHRKNTGLGGEAESGPSAGRTEGEA